MICKECNTENGKMRYFCVKCGTFFHKADFEKSANYVEQEKKVLRILENLKHNPHHEVVWNESIDRYTEKMERIQSLLSLKEFGNKEDKLVSKKMNEFLNLCHEPEFHIAFVGTIKTGKSTLINSLLGKNYASMAVTPETAALTKFRSSEKDYVKVTFYTEAEWRKLWDSRTSGADSFMNEYKELHAEEQKKTWVGHDIVYKELANDKVEEELMIWSSSKRAEHYFVKEVEVGISDFRMPKQIVLVDTPGLSDPVVYRSEITKEYIRRANAVFVCVDAQKVQKDEIATISSVFSFSSHNKNKVHVISTHWDKLNNPVEDWKVQKEWLVKQLIGKGFYDTKEMAESNILHSAAHIYNLARDYQSITAKDKRPLMQFAIAFDIEIDEVQDNLSHFMKLSNIEELRSIISNKLVKNYVELLYSDILKLYSDIIGSLKRYAQDMREEGLKVVAASNESIDELKKREMNEKKNLNEINKCKKQLEDALSTVKVGTQKRLDTIIPKLRKLAQ